LTSTANLREQIDVWLKAAEQAGASDLHLMSGYPATIRLHGELQPVDALARETQSTGTQSTEIQPTDSEPLGADRLREALLELCSDSIRETFLEHSNADFAYCTPRTHRETSQSHPLVTGQNDSEQVERDSEQKVRARVNYFQSREGVGACFRIIASKIPELAWAGFPESLAERLIEFRNGLVLLTGMTGAGKSTSLAMIVDMLNRKGRQRIVTIEDPIEFRYEPVGGSIVSQREVGSDVSDFAQGLRFALRQDPDVILVGEIRDYETAQMALSAAETGHLVLSTLHTRDAKGAISRFADLFPQSVQAEVRAQLAMSLRAIVSQHLLPCAYEPKRKLALEILFNSNSIGAGIRTGKLETIDTGIITGRSDGMISLDESINRLLEDHSISRETALKYISNPDALKR